MTYKQIVVWFQNRRAKQRSDERKLYFSARQSPAATGNHYSQRAVQLPHNPSVAGAPQQYPTASAAMNLVQMATPAGRTHVLTTSFASQEPVHFQPAASGFQATACSPQQHDPSGMKMRIQQPFGIGHSSLTGGSPYLPSPGSRTPSPPSPRTGRSLPSPPNGLAPSKAMVLPPPPQGGAAVGSDLLRFSLASSHFQSHIPLKPPTPPLSHKGEPSHPVPATLS